MTTRRYALRVIAAVGAAALASPAAAIAVIDFLKLEAHEQRLALEPVIHSYLRVGYKKVPDWIPLSIEIRKIALEKGYSYQSLDQVAKEAALRLGMTS